ncbi:hypothetical protein PGTUg99_030119 [Puccinia graminis f. sp. tritici]|uniref:Uncharacterized protein n=1 Tax=Puccinia graminis f. sp. tritici TaxID=56615 RepID=A0A5B0SNZ9_PUCGR|nr:hypothetical protein PGTUg99_030119 [Puccinia graminis f. sp. tritici]
MGRVFRKTPQQTDGFRPERAQLGCEASNGRSGSPGIIWTLQKASKGCSAGETIQRMVYSPVSIGHLIGSVRWTTRKPSIGHFSECPIDGFHPGPAVEKKGSMVEKCSQKVVDGRKTIQKCNEGCIVDFLTSTYQKSWLLILPSDGWFGPAIRIQQYASRIQWMLVAGPSADGIWYIRLGVQMPSTTPGGVGTYLWPSEGFGEILSPTLSAEGHPLHYTPLHKAPVTQRLLPTTPLQHTLTPPITRYTTHSSIDPFHRTSRPPPFNKILRTRPPPFNKILRTDLIIAIKLA